MPVSLFWDEVEPDVLRFAFRGQWTWDELNEATHQVAAMCATRPGRIDVISDLFGAPYRPGQFADNLNRLIANYKRESKLNRIVLTMSEFNYLLYRTFARQNPRTLTYDVAPDVNAARELIRAARQELPLPDYVPVELLV